MKLTCGGGGNATVNHYACKDDHPVCYPDCAARYTTSNSVECSAAAFNRPDLHNEVATRKSTTDTPQRIMTQYAAEDASHGEGAYKLNMAFLNSATTACNGARYCERVCTDCKVPNEAGDACVAWNCPTLAGVNSVSYELVGSTDGAVHTFVAAGYGDGVSYTLNCYAPDNPIPIQTVALGAHGARYFQNLTCVGAKANLTVASTNEFGTGDTNVGLQLCVLPSS
jgi:hypothetical protein